MSFNVDGFLSLDVANIIMEARRANSDWFALVQRLRRISQSALMEIAVPNDRHAITMNFIFARAVTSFQSIEILAERGLAADARAITRSFLETTVYYGAVKSDPALIERLIGADRRDKENIAKPLIQKGVEPSGLDAAAIARLQAWLADADAPKPDSIKVEQLMKKLEMDDIYDTFFRGLSGDAVHTTVTSLNRHASIDANGEINGTRFGPDFDDIENTLMTACTIMFCLLLWVRGNFPELSGGDEIESCWEEYKRITGPAA